MRKPTIPRPPPPKPPPESPRRSSTSLLRPPGVQRIKCYECRTSPLPDAIPNSHQRKKRRLYDKVIKAARFVHQARILLEVSPIPQDCPQATLLPRRSRLLLNVSAVH